MKLDFARVPEVITLVALYFFARLVGKSTSAFTAMSLSGVTANVRNYMGIALLPHGGVAVGLIILVQNEASLADVEPVVTTVGLATLAINQLVGPSATRFALQRAGEDHMDRPRLLDFLDEPRIVTELTGSNKTEVISRLVDQLYATTKMEIEKDAFLDAVMEREQSVTTCFGEGLMIPHAIIESGNEVRGVLGISSEGLDLNAPDGRPVHCVLLLATPADERNRHLEILSAFAKAITQDVNMREQLYHAHSSAHAYDILHADDAMDVNYFLEDAMERVSEQKE